MSIFKKIFGSGESLNKRDSAIIKLAEEAFKKYEYKLKFKPDKIIVEIERF